MTATVVPFHSSPEPAFVPERVPAPAPETCVVDTAEDFETLRDRAREFVAKGSYREAATVYQRAVEVATAAGETDLADEALCGWGAAETELGNGAEAMPELRRILLGSPVDHNCCLAAYTLARAHELEGQIKKALFYARLFRDRAEYVERGGLPSLAQNLLGNLLVAEGRETEAAACYRTALRHAKNAPSTWKVAAETNLGYCLVVSAAGSRGMRRTRMREGLRLIYRSIRTFRREGAVQYCMLPHLDLCFAHLELKRPTYARRHGQRALELAKRYDDSATIKNSLYLLGHVALLEADKVAARHYFGELEQRFYPHQAGLTDLLMSVDFRQVVNLRA
ncbi:MAG: hypothetical protein F4172_08460 [Holophagales bacterium]|nr:hypothetical protein [Holophagales bacterium]MYG30516.1 hypothetical protein [Holophagales bacterium]